MCTWDPGEETQERAGGGGGGGMSQHSKAPPEHSTPVARGCYLHIQPCHPSPTERGRRRQGREEEMSRVAIERSSKRAGARCGANPGPPGTPPTQAPP